MLWDSDGRQGFDVVTQANERHVLLVLKGGLPMFGDAVIMENLGWGNPDCEILNVCGESRRICAMRETGQAFPTSFMTPFAACGVPVAGERSCIPSRGMPLPTKAPYFTGARVAGDLDGGTISGLSSGSLYLSMNGGTAEEFSSNGAFEFSRRVEEGKPYDIGISTQAPLENCTITGFSGVVSDADIDSVIITCSGGP